MVGWPTSLANVKTQRAHRVLFLCLVLVLLLEHSLWLAGQWPGFFNYDTFVNIIDARAGVFSRWVSYSYSSYIMALQWIQQSPGFIGVAQSLAASVLTAAFFVWTYRASGSRRVFISLIIFCLVPLHFMTSIYYTRNWLFSWVHVTLVVLFSIVALQYRYQRRSPRLWCLMALSGLAIVLSDLRQDGKLVLGALLLLFIFVFFSHRRALGRFFALVVIPFALLTWTGFLEIKPERVYRLTGLVNPLSYMLHNGVVPSEEDRLLIERVFDYGALMTNYSEYEIPAFHSGAWRRGFTEADLSALQDFLFRSIRQHPKVFLQNRLKMARGLLGNQHTILIVDDLGYRPTPGSPIARFREQLNLNKAPLSPLFNAWQWPTVRRSYAGFGKDWDMSNHLPLALCLLGLGLFYFLPITAAASALILVRVPLVFLMASAPQLHYLYSVFLFAFAIVPLAMVEWQMRKSGRNSAKKNLEPI